MKNKLFKFFVGFIIATYSNYLVYCVSLSKDLGHSNDVYLYCTMLANNELDEKKFDKRQLAHLTEKMKPILEFKKIKEFTMQIF